MRYPFRCDACGEEALRRGRGGPPSPPPCPSCSRPMRRVYTPPQFILYHSAVEYVNRAIEGRERVPGMTREQVERVARTYDRRPPLRRPFERRRD